MTSPSNARSGPCQDSSYYRARYYDPAAGRFIAEDPIGFNGGLDFFVYTANSPGNLSDPLGETFAVQGDAAAWQMAITYLCISAEACSLINELAQSSTVYQIFISDRYTIDEASGAFKVYWNPHMGLCVKNGNQSPALQLLHELFHLGQWKHNVPRNEENATSFTNPTANLLGEPTRLNYADAGKDSTWFVPVPDWGDNKCQCQGQQKQKK